jgi:hypothetical protein
MSTWALDAVWLLAGPETNAAALVDYMFPQIQRNLIFSARLWATQVRMNASFEWTDTDGRAIDVNASTMTQHLFHNVCMHGHLHITPVAQGTNYSTALGFRGKV